MNQEEEYFTASTMVVDEVMENKVSVDTTHPEVYYG